MVEANEDFELRLSEKETGEILFKHSKPLNYLINKLILKHDAEALESEVAIYNDNGETKFTTPYIINDELNQVVRYLAKKEGVQLTLDEKNGKVSPTKLLKVIKDEFDLNEYYLKTSNGSSKKYTTIQKRIDGEVKRIYPELVKTDYYDELLQEMNKELGDDNETKDN